MWWVYLGGAIEAAGLIVTGAGIRATWSAVSEEPLAEPLLDAGRRGWRRTVRGLRWVVRRSPEPTVQHHTRGQVDAISLVDHASISVIYAPLDPEMPTDDVLALFDERMRGLRRDLDSANLQQNQRLTDLAARVDTTDHRVDGLRADLQATEERLAIEGLRVEAVGLALVGVGLAVQLVGGLVAAIV